MSWRSGSSMFVEFWPLIKKYMPERDLRVEFTTELLRVFLDWDMDPYDVEDIDADVSAALLKVDHGLADADDEDDFSNE